MHTEVSSVQFAGQRNTWPADHVYVGMPGNAARSYGIPDAEGLFGKPWAFKDDPRGWAPVYSEYVAKRMLADETFAAKVRDLHGKVLLCYCVAKAQKRGTEVQCHARILAEYVELEFHSRRHRAAADAHAMGELTLAERDDHECSQEGSCEHD